MPSSSRPSSHCRYCARCGGHIGILHLQAELGFCAVLYIHIRRLKCLMRGDDSGASARDSISCNVRQRGGQPATVYLLRPYGCRGGVCCQRAIRRSRVRAFGFLRSNAKRPLMILQSVLKVVIEEATGPSRRPFLCPHCHAPTTVVGMKQTFSCRHATASGWQSRASIPNSCSQPQADRKSVV